MIHQSISKSSISSISSIPAAKPRTKDFYYRPRIRSEAVDSTKKVDCELSSSSSKTKSSPSKLFESNGASSKGPYPRGMGPFTGRDPDVKKPEWLRQKAPQGERFQEVKDSLSRLKLNMVCEEAQCPIWER